MGSLSCSDPTFVLTRHWRQLGLALDEADFTDAQAMASIARITGGNFRLLGQKAQARKRGCVGVSAAVYANATPDPGR